MLNAFQLVLQVFDLGKLNLFAILPIHTVEVGQVTRRTCFQMGKAGLQLGGGEVIIPVIDGLELAPIEMATLTLVNNPIWRQSCTN